jgi:hypothetical protein
LSSRPFAPASDPVGCPDDILLQVARASACVQEDDLDGARAAMAPVLQRPPGDPAETNLVGLLHFAHGNLARARDVYLRGIAHWGDWPPLLFNVAVCDRRLGRLLEARRSLERLVVMRPRHRRAWLCLGLVHVRMGEAELARVAFARGRLAKADHRRPASPARRPRGAGELVALVAPSSKEAAAAPQDVMPPLAKMATHDGTAQEEVVAPHVGMGPQAASSPADAAPSEEGDLPLPGPSSYEPFRANTSSDGPFRANPSSDGPFRANPSSDEPFRANPSSDEPFRANPSSDEPFRANPSSDGPFRANPSSGGPFRADPSSDGPSGANPEAAAAIGVEPPSNDALPPPRGREPSLADVQLTFVPRSMPAGPPAARSWLTLGNAFTAVAAAAAGFALVSVLDRRPASRPVPIDPAPLTREVPRLEWAKLPEAPVTARTEAARPRSGTVGTLRTPESASGHRVFVDGWVRCDSGAQIELPCGPHDVQVGSAGRRQRVVVPCGGEVDVEP